MLYDGACALCHRGVQFVLRHERAGEPRLRFASLQSEAGRALLIDAGLDPDDINSVVVLFDGAVLLESDAALSIAGTLRRPWSWIRVARYVPKPLRDCGYRAVARLRHRWTGPAEICDTSAWKSRDRFLDA